VFVPYLQSEPTLDDQGEPGPHGVAPISVKRDKPAPNGAAFDAIFVHRATPDNISRNNTYLDSPQTNDDSNVVL